MIHALLAMGLVFVCQAQRRLSWWRSRVLGFGFLALAALALHACGPNHAEQSTVTGVPGGSITWTPTATPAEIASDTPILAAWIAHWTAPPEAAKSINVHVQRQSELLLHDSYRIPGSGNCWVQLDDDGTVSGYSWEIPMLAQGVYDPPAWTWGEWGPLYSGQAAWSVAATSPPPVILTAQGGAR